jgi:phosphoserine phosphatase RsbU/P
VNSSFQQELRLARDEMEKFRLEITSLSDSNDKTDRSEILDRLTGLESSLKAILSGFEFRMEFELLRNLAVLLAKAVDEDEVLSAILEGMQEAIPYDAAGIFIIGGDEEEDETSETSILAHVVKGYHIRRKSKLQQKVDEGILGWVVRNGQSQNVEDVLKDPRYIVSRESTRSELAVPITLKNKVIGCMNVESDCVAAFSQGSERLLEHLATLAAIALDQAQMHRELVISESMERELEIAREIQLKLLPSDPPITEKIDIAGLNVPSSGVGGDYYDYISLTKNDLGIVIADVAGKGVPAGLVMAGFRAALRGRVDKVYSISHVMSEINQFLYESTGSERFVTAFYGVLDQTRSQLTYINAGHNPPMIIHADGRTEWLDAGGPLLGVLDKAEYQLGTAIIEPGAILVLYTDGIVEAGGERGEEFGENRIEELVRTLAERPAAEIARTLEREAVKFNRSRKNLDDRTVIVVKCL